jgi:uncharacterized membrane protein
MKGTMMGESMPITLIISIAALALSAYTGISSQRRASRAEHKDDASQIAEISIKLAHAYEKITDLEEQNMKAQENAQNMRDRIIALEGRNVAD